MGATKRTVATDYVRNAWKICEGHPTCAHSVELTSTKASLTAKMNGRDTCVYQTSEPVADENDQLVPSSSQAMFHHVESRDSTGKHVQSATLSCFNSAVNIVVVRGL